MLNNIFDDALYISKSEVFVCSVSDHEEVAQGMSGLWEMEGEEQPILETVGVPWSDRSAPCEHGRHPITELVTRGGGFGWRDEC